MALQKGSPLSAAMSMTVSPTFLPTMEIIEVKGEKKKIQIAIKYKITRNKLHKCAVSM